MHVAHLTASTFYGGPERQMVGLARAMAGSQKTSLLSFREGGRCEEFLGVARRHGIPAYALEHDTPHLLAAVRELARFLTRTHAALLCCHGYKANLLGRLAARRCRVPIVAVSRGWTGESLKIRLYEALDRWHLRWMDGVVCVSRSQAEKVQHAGVPPERISIIVNSIDPTRFREAEPGTRNEMLDLFRDRPTRLVGSAGRLSPEKGFDVLVAAAARVAAADRAVGFVVFGEGPCRPELQRHIDAVGLGERFVLAGFRPDFDRLLPALDVFVLPSFTEGMPNVVLEASAAGVPVVATAVGGTPEILLDGHSGILVPPGNSTALATGVAGVLASPNQAQTLKSNARRRVRENFTFAAQARHYRDLFAGLCRPAAEAGPTRSVVRLGEDRLRASFASNRQP